MEKRCPQGLKPSTVKLFTARLKAVPFVRQTSAAVATEGESRRYSGRSSAGLLSDDNL